MRLSFVPVQSLPTFEDIARQSILAESLGFDALWIHEHHSGGVMYSSPLIVLSYLAGKTSRIELGTNMLLLPLHHPLRVAEEGALVDAESCGRLRLGLSAGYSATDLRAFNVEAGNRGERMEEGLTLIRALWTEDLVTIEDRFTHLRDFTLFPKPVRKPSPPIYVGATVDNAIRRAARLGDEFLISTTQRKEDIPRVKSVYDSELLRLGKNPGEKTTTINRIVLVVENNSAKLDAERFFGERFLKLYDAWGHQNVTVLNRGSRSFEQVSHDHFIIGKYSECIDRIVEYSELGIGEIACLMNFGGPDLDSVDKSMRLMAEHVMPHFK